MASTSGSRALIDRAGPPASPGRCPRRRGSRNLRPGGTGSAGSRCRSSSCQFTSSPRMSPQGRAHGDLQVESPRLTDSGSRRSSASRSSPTVASFRGRAVSWGADCRIRNVADRLAAVASDAMADPRSAPPARARRLRPRVPPDARDSNRMPSQMDEPIQRLVEPRSVSTEPARSEAAAADRTTSCANATRQPRSDSENFGHYSADFR